jgi:hypothetical protein
MLCNSLLPFLMIYMCMLLVLVLLPSACVRCTRAIWCAAALLDKAELEEHNCLSPGAVAHLAVL